ncbi:MAG: hypothetical protein IJU75_05390 [Clostridia bacterium]|nr:hypothetical protein [Clostridia bacterium]
MLNLPEPRRVTLFCGHYGSGKTNIAVNYAFYLKNAGYDVVVADLDIVNPYFRTKDSEDELKAAGIGVISQQFANSNVDLPALPSEIYSIVQNRKRYAVIDVGGDDRGAYALGRLVPGLIEENDYSMLDVVNFYRPLTGTAADALAVMREIEAACGLGFNGIVNNSNLGAESTPETLTGTFGKAEELSVKSGVPLFMNCAEKSVADELGNVFPLVLQERYYM